MRNQIVELTARPEGQPGPEHFTFREAPFPSCAEGGLLVESLYLAVDPAMRGWISAAQNYANAVPLGSVMRAMGVGRVIESRHPDWREGDHLFGWLGWRRFAAIGPEAAIWPVNPQEAPLSSWLSVLGLNGITAWIGLKRFSYAKPGETLLVSTAAGGVGSIVCQLGRREGLSVIGLTSSDYKVGQCLDSFGCTSALNYRAVADLAGEVSKAAPDGVDIFFDSTGGWIADAVFPSMRVGGRIIQCGTTSVASWDPWPVGARRERSILTKRLSWHGFLAFDNVELAKQALAALVPMVAAGEINHTEEIIPGLENAPEALAALYRGENTGRVCIRL